MNDLLVFVIAFLPLADERLETLYLVPFSLREGMLEE